MNNETGWLVGQAVHHAAMCTMWLEGSRDVSIVQLIKSLGVMKQLVESVESSLAAGEVEPTEE